MRHHGATLRSDPPCRCGSWGSEDAAGGVGLRRYPPPVTVYVIEAEPGGPRTAAMVGSVLRDAGATFNPIELDERRGADQVLQAVRVSFEIAGDLSLVWAGIKVAQERFPRLKVQIRKRGERPSGQQQLS